MAHPFESLLLMRSRPLLFTLSLLLPALSSAQESERLSTVQVSGVAQSVPLPEGALRRSVSAEELLRMNDSRLADALRRLPGLGVQPGRPGQPDQLSLLGLGPGRTQILLNGRRVPPGFSLDDIAPEQIARVEILRGNSAGLGGEAIAGSVNLVLKPAPRRSTRRLQLGGSRQAGGSGDLRLQAQQGGALPGTELAQGLTLTALQRDWQQTLALDSRSDTSQRHEQQHYQGRSRQLQLAPQLSWNGEGGNSLSWNGQLEQAWMHRQVGYLLQAEQGAAPDYPQHDEAYRQRRQAWRSDLDGRWQLAPGWQLQGGLGGQGQHQRSHFTDLGPGLDDLTQGRVRERSGQGQASLVGELGQAHTLTLGLSASRHQREEGRDQWLDGQPVSALRLAAGQTRAAWFVQDEWELSPSQQLALGWRHERLVLSSEAVRQRLGQDLPSLSWLWQLPAGQWRSVLSRSFRAPSLMQLQPRPYTSANNTALDPDMEGNPALRPERAWALDLQFQPRLPRDHRLSLGALWRVIDDPLMSATQWRNGALGLPRWVRSPLNGQRAWVRGLELEGQWPLRPGLVLEAQATRSWSRLRAVAGQPAELSLEDFNPLRAQLALQGRSATWGQWRLAYAWQSGAWRRTAPGERGRQQPQARLDASLQRPLADGWQLNAGVEGLLQPRPLALDDYVDAQGQVYTGQTRGQARVALRLGLQRSF